MTSRRYSARITAAIGLIIAAIGIVLATPTAAPASSGGFFEIVNPVFGGCLDVINESSQSGVRIQEFHCKNNNAQLWAPDVQPDLHLLWRNRGSGKCLHATSNSVGASVDQQDCNGFDSAQRWQWGFADSIGHLVLISDFPGLCLALAEPTRTDGTAIVVRDCATTATQFFRIDS